MDAPPPHEDPGPFLAIARWLGERGFAAPRILADDAAAGLVLLEDFGDVRMRETVDARPDAADRLYSAAIDVLVALHKHPAGPLKPYDRAELQREAGLFVDRSEEHTSELQSLMRISSAVFCLNKKKK